MRSFFIVALFLSSCAASTERDDYDSGTYTPELVVGRPENLVDLEPVGVWSWLRIGDVVAVTGRVQATWSSPAVASPVFVSLPSEAVELSGSAVADDWSGGVPTSIAQLEGDELFVNLQTVTGTDGIQWAIQAQYVVP